MRGRLHGAVAFSLAAGGCLSSPPRGDDGGSGECGTTRVLRDDFEAEQLAEERWHGEQINMDGGAVEIWATPDTFGFLSSQAVYRVAGGDVQIELGLDAYSSDSRLTLWLSGESSAVGIELDDDLIKLARDDGEEVFYPDSAPYSASWTWWRLWEVDGELHWGVSPDGVEWEDLGSVAWDEPFAYVEIWVEGQSASSTVDVLSVNQHAADERHCPASSFTEEFDRLDRWWSQLDAPCQMGAAGQLVLEAAAPAVCTVSSRERFDLRGGAVAVELTDAGDCEPSPLISLSWEAGYADVVCTDVEGEVRLIAFTESGDGSSLLYDPEEHRYLRLRHDEEQRAILWETHTASDGDWVQFDVQEVDADDVAAVEVHLSLEGEPSDDPVDSAVFDKINLVP